MVNRFFDGFNGMHLRWKFFFGGGLLGMINILFDRVYVSYSLDLGYVFLEKLFIVVKVFDDVVL